MGLSTTTLSGRDGTALHCRCWEPSRRPRGVVAFCHGIGEHGGRYADFADALNRLGAALVVCDLRGHGGSEGKRGHAASYLDLLADYVTGVHLARNRFPEARLFGGGHSLGGLIALGSAAANLLSPDCRGLIVSGPALAVGFEPPRWKVAAARLLSRLLPGGQFSTGLEAGYLSHDPEVVRAYREDPLVHDKISARAYVETLRLQEMTRAGAPRITQPLLILQGSDDHDVDPTATRAFFEAAASTDKTCREYPGFYHEVLNETGREKVVADVTAWLAERLEAGV